MSRILDYITGAISGLERYFAANKLIVVLFAVLLAGWLAEKKFAEEKGSRMLMYTLVMSILLICPLTAVAVMIYQTAFYDYEWAWSMVPITAVIAYAGAWLIDKGFSKKKKLLGVLLAVAVLFLCGNQGTLQVVETKEALAAEAAGKILQSLEGLGGTGQKILWAPKNIMQEVRRQDGKILLIYGRDMWDEKAGAYDYESYNESLTNAYLWLESMTELTETAAGMEEPLKSLKLLCQEKQLDEQTEGYLWIMVDAGVNTYVFPNLLADYLQEDLESIAAQRMLTVRTAYTEEYTIYFMTTIQP